MKVFLKPALQGSFKEIQTFAKNMHRVDKGFLLDNLLPVCINFLSYEGKTEENISFLGRFCCKLENTLNILI